MKNKKVKVYCILLFLVTLIHVQAQNTVSTSGGVATGIDGTASYTLGQVFYQTNIANDNIAVTEGVQQSYEFTLGLNMSLQGRIDYFGDYTVILYPFNDLVNPAYSLIETANPDGNITLSTKIVQGNYKILVKHPMYLQRLISVNLTGNQTETVTELLAGDVDNNNSINIFDFGIFTGTFSLSSGQDGYDGRADFDNNFSVNIFDFGLLSGNFGQTGKTQND